MNHSSSYDCPKVDNLLVQMLSILSIAWYQTRTKPPTVSVAEWPRVVADFNKDSTNNGSTRFTDSP